MPVAKGLPEKPSSKLKFESLPTYVIEMEKYIDALENWIDIRAFQDGDDEVPTIKGTANFSLELKTQEKETMQKLLDALSTLNEETIKEWIVHKYPHGYGLYE
jgi:hypothetical protein